MNTGRTPGAGAPVVRFRHEALLYAGPAQFVARASAFVRDALAAGEAVMVAVVEPRASLLREELADDARHVRFVDMDAVGPNPGRIIPVWQDWVGRHAGGGRGFRGVGEPVWAGRTPAELAECVQHEDLINTAFGDGPPWWLVCPYDTESLDRHVVDQACRAHPGLLDGALTTTPGAGRAQPGGPVLTGDALPEPAGPVSRTAFGLGDLTRLRRIAAEYANAAGLTPQRVAEFALVVNELACNSIRHGGGTGVLRLWREPGMLLCEVRDRGLIADPLAGRRRPGPVPGGAGLWIVNQLCDLVRIRSAPEDGTTVRVHVATPR